MQIYFKLKFFQNRGIFLKKSVTKIAVTGIMILAFLFSKGQSNITRVEYYIDTDPGFGKATSVSITPTTNIVDKVIAINPASISEGVHKFYVRAMNASGAWGFTNSLLFYKPITNIGVPPPLPAAPANITKLEYYIDTDPGYGKAKNMTITAGIDIKDLTIAVDISNLPLGKHMFYVRALNAKGAWSMMNALEFSNGVVSAGPYYVDSSAISGLNNGSSWANAFLNLQDAIKIAKANDTIFVAKGTYYPDRGVGLTNDERSLSFNIRDSSVMLGGFPSGGGSLASRNWNTNKTILSGEIQNDSDSTNNSMHVVITTHVSDKTIVDGFFITRAYNNTPGGFVGGGWFNDGSGIGNRSNPLIRNCTFYRNYGTFGGGLCNNGENGNASPFIQGCIFIQNGAQEGGAILNFGESGITNPTIINCDFIENSSISSGGVIRNRNSNPETKGQNCVVLSNSRFYNNSGGDGGVLNFSSDSTCTSIISNCEFKGNTSTHWGGVLYTHYGRVEFVNCIMSGNNASQGAAIFDFLTDLTITNCVISGNFNTNQGVIILTQGTDGRGIFKRIFPQINNSIFWNNNERIFQSFNANPQINHCLFSVSQFDSIFIATDIKDSLVNQGGNIFGQDPKFVNSPTSLVAPTILGDFHLQAQSIAINNGLNSLVKSEKDLDGNPRIQNGIVDMGAYEFIAAQSAPAITSIKSIQLCQGDTVTINGSNFLNSLDPNIQAVKINAVQGNVVSASTILIKAIFNQAVKGKVTVSNINGTAISLDTVTIIAAPTVASIPNQEVCVGGNTTAITFSGTGTNYSWVNNNTGTGLAASGTGNIAVFLSKNITNFQIASTIMVTPLNTNGCKGIPASFNIFVDPIITAAPVIFQSAGLLSINSTPGGSGITGYQWMKDSIAISGANSSTYQPPMNGIYSAAFTNFCGLGPKSNEIKITITVEPPPTGIAKGIYIDSSAAGLHNGTSWANAYTSLQDALVTAKAGDTILVAQGTYYPDQGKNLNNDDRSLSFDFRDGVVVYGGFPSGGGSLSSRNWVGNRTILSGEIQQDDSRGNNSYHVITSKNVSGMTTLDGLIITSGYANGTAATQTNGGGWYNDGSGLNNISNPTIRNCSFILNYASNGAGLFNNGDANGTASPTVINSIFMNNLAVSNGGAVYNLATHGGMSNTSLTNCLIRNNNALYGGAMYNNGTQGNCTPTLINCLLYLNLAGDGAAISSVGSQGTCVTTIINSIVWANIKFAFANTNATINLSYSLTEATTGYIDKGNNKIGQNPFFVLINSDLHLTDKSPAINAGINSVNAESKDLDGTARIMNEIIDMGPYEFKANAFANNLLESRSSLSTIDLLQNIPNPFSKQTRIGIYMDKDRRGELRIFDLLGRSIKSYDQIWHSGYNEVRMDKSELKQPGVYYYRFESGDFKSVRKMVLFE